MSFRYPRHKFPTAAVIDPDDVNESFFDIVEEVSGRLNEHNWKAGAITDRENVAEDAAYHVYTDSETDTETTTDSGTGTADTFAVPYDATWHAIDDMAADIASGPGGALWIIGSLQCDGQGEYGAFFAIRVNGQVLPETIIGTAELDQDVTSRTTLGNSVSTPGVAWGRIPIVVEAVFVVPPGPYLVEIVAMGYPNYTGGLLDDIFISNRELIVLEMAR